MLRSPEAIEAESFRIIEEEAGPNLFSPEEWAVVRRVIHATADFDFMENIRFSTGALEAGLGALRRGVPMIADVKMLKAGLHEGRLRELGGRSLCFIGHKDVARRAEEEGISRAAAGMRKGARVAPQGVFLIGNAPTALHEILELAEKGKAQPSLIVGMPVGFVEAAESKERLARSPFSSITALGRKGGSAAAAAVANALLILALRGHHKAP